MQIIDPCKRKRVNRARVVARNVPGNVRGCWSNKCVISSIAGNSCRRVGTVLPATQIERRVTVASSTRQAGSFTAQTAIHKADSTEVRRNSRTQRNPRRREIQKRSIRCHLKQIVIGTGINVENTVARDGFEAIAQQRYGVGTGTCLNKHVRQRSVRRQRCASSQREGVSRAACFVFRRHVDRYRRHVDQRYGIERDCTTRP